MSTSRGRCWPLVAAALLLHAGCATETTGFPGGVEPWEVPADAPSEWPAPPATPGTVAVVTGNRIGNGSTPSYSWAHGRVLLAAPIADVWAALQWRPGVLLAVAPDTQVDCEPTNGVEPGYEASFSVKEIPNANGDLGRRNWFLVYWRASATRDAVQSIRKVNVKAQKVDGTTFIALMRQSIVATPVAGGGTELEIVRHINAPGEDPATAGDWIGLWVSALEAQLAGSPSVPESRCFP
jgi:hypothetical protein